MITQEDVDMFWKLTTQDVDIFWKTIEMSGNKILTTQEDVDIFWTPI